MMTARTKGRNWFRVAQAAILAAAITVSLGAGDSGARFDYLSHQLMCSCGCGQVLGECNHVGCPDSPGQLAELRDALSSSMSDKQILNQFAAKYGATVLAAPTTEGFNLVAWIAPFAVFLSALLGTILLIRHWSASAKRAPTAGTRESDRLRERIRRETGSEGGF